MLDVLLMSSDKVVKGKDFVAFFNESVAKM